MGDEELGAKRAALERAAETERALMVERSALVTQLTRVLSGDDEGDAYDILRRGEVLAIVAEAARAEAIRLEAELEALTRPRRRRRR